MRRQAADPVDDPTTPWQGDRRVSVRSIAGMLLLFGVLKVVAQTVITLLATHAGYGLHRDELYYIVCGEHLAWGYVDQPPLVALQALVAYTLFGAKHLVLFRLLPALGGACTVVLTGLLARELGGSRRAICLAMLFVLTVPVFLATQSFLSMNAWSPVFWMLAVLALLRLRAAPYSLRMWLLLGASIGFGVENKVDTTFLAIAILLAMAAVPSQRSLLRRRGILVAVGTVLLLALPNLVWQATHGFPTWVWLRAVQHSTKDVVLSPPKFLLAQVLMLSPLHLLVWLPGLAWLLFARAARPWRVAGVLYLFFLAIMLGLHAKDYYVAPVYPLPIAAGAVFWSEWAAASRARFRALVTGATLLTALALITVPFTVPVLPPAVYVRYARLTDFQPMESENHPPTLLPEFFADQRGWATLAADVREVFQTLPPAQRAYTGIVADNYGQASAVNVLDHGDGLPFTISGHQNYWLWGPHGETGQEMLVISSRPLADLLREFQSCRVAMTDLDRYQMPWEQRRIFVCYDRRTPYQQDWPAMRLYW